MWVLGHATWLLTTQANFVLLCFKWVPLFCTSVVMSDVVCEMHHATWPYTISLRRSTLPPPAVPLLWRPRHSGKEHCYFSIIHKVKEKQIGSRPLLHCNVSALSNTTIFFVSLYYSVFTTLGNETVNKTNAINYLLWNIAIIREKFQRPSEPCCLNPFLYQFSPLSTFQRTEALIRYVDAGLDVKKVPAFKE